MVKIFTLPEKLLVIGKSELSEDKFISIKNRQNFIKPEGGLWTSPYTPNNQFYSAWHEWCSNEDFSSGLSGDGVLIELNEDALYYVIDSQEDLIDFIKIVGRQGSEIEKLVGYEMWIIPDWENASKMFDVIYLTQNGAWETHMPMEKSRYNLYGWDCETCLIMNYSSIEDAIILAAQAHKGQIDKGGQPYILHPLRVMLNMNTEEARIIAVLHDVIEDTDIELSTLKKYEYSDEIIKAIEALTRLPEENYTNFIKRVKENNLAKLVKMADIDDNSNINRISNPTEKDYRRIKKYNKALNELIK